MKVKKFRGWNKKTKKLVHGWGCYTNSDDKHFILEDMDGKIKHIQVEEIEMYTGMRDKRKVEIYDGDLVKVGSVGFSKSDWIGRVMFPERKGFYGWFIKATREVDLAIGISNFNDMVTIEVIGNIHDNPEISGVN